MSKILDDVTLYDLRDLLREQQIATVTCTVISSNTTYPSQLGYEAATVPNRTTSTIEGWLYDVYAGRLGRIMQARFGLELQAIGELNMRDFVFIYMADSTVQLEEGDTIEIDSKQFTVSRRITDSVGLLHAAMLKR